MKRFLACTSTLQEFARIRGDLSLPVHWQAIPRLLSIWRWIYLDSICLWRFTSWSALYSGWFSSSAANSWKEGILSETYETEGVQAVELVTIKFLLDVHKILVAGPCLRRVHVSPVCIHMRCDLTWCLSKETYSYTATFRICQGKLFFGPMDCEVSLRWPSDWQLCWYSVGDWCTGTLLSC